MAECRTNSPTNFCKTYPDARCVVYTGVRLPCINVNTNDRLEEILAKIDEKVCSSVGTGTVTSVSASITSGAISITGSPITTSGTLAFTYTGTSSQYIAGDGSLVTFPSIPVITNEWHITGNEDTTAGTNFLGTTDLQDLVFKTNAIEWARLSTAGYLGLHTTSPTSKLHIKTDNIITTQSDANGIFLQNTTAATAGVPVQMSPPIVWQGRVWETGFGGSNRSQTWKADILPYQLSSFGRYAYWQLSQSENGGAYITKLKLASSGNLEVFNSLGTAYGSFNNNFLGGANSGGFYWNNTNQIPVNYLTVSGSDNTASGLISLFNLSSGSYNSAFGSNTGRTLTTSELNSFFGFQSGYSVTTGTGQNAFYGANSGLFVTTGFKNSFFGAGAGENTTIGQENVALGQDSGLNNTIGVYNVYVGVNAKGGAGGIGNIILGYYAGASLASPLLGDTTDNIFLGRNTGFNASQKTDAKNTIAIGTGAFTTADNQMVLGNTSITETFIRGAKITAPNYFYGELANGSLTKRTLSEVLADIGGISSVPISSLIAATGTNTIDNANFGQTWDWTGLQNTGLSLNSSTTTAPIGEAHKVLSVTTNGANANSAAGTFAIHATNTHTGASSINYGVLGNASGGSFNVGVGGRTSAIGTDNFGVRGSADGAGTNNYGGYFTAINGTNNVAIAVPSGSGNVGIGTIIPGYKLEVVSNDANIFAADINNTNAAANSSGLAVRVYHSNSTGQILQLLSGGSGSTQVFKVSPNGDIYADALSSATEANIIYYNTTTKKLTYGAVPATGITVGSTTVTSGVDTGVFFQDGSVVGQDVAGFSYNKTTDALTIAGNIVVPTVYGSIVANGDLILEGTSHATKATSYVRLQPTSGGVHIGTVGGPGTIAQLLQLDGGATGTIFQVTGSNPYNPALTTTYGGNTHMYTFDSQNFSTNTAGNTTMTGGYLRQISGAYFQGYQQAFSLIHEYASVGSQTLILDQSNGGGPDPTASTYKILQGKFLTVEQFAFYGDGKVVFNETGDAAGDFRVEGDTDVNLLFTDASANNIGVGTSSPSARLHLAAGTATANTAPLQFTTGTSETVARAGVMEYTTPQLFFTNGAAIRQEIPQIQQARVSTQYDNTTTTLGAVTGLTTNVAAGKTYRFEAKLYTTSNVAGGVKAAIAGTATATNIIYDGVTTDNTAIIQSRSTALGTAVGATTTVTAAYIIITGTITVNAAGTLLVQAAANVATGTTSVLVGSTFVITEML